MSEEMENNECRTRVWWVQSKPFNEEDRKSNKLEEFQEYCLNQRLFGMGWKEDRECLFKEYIDEVISSDLVNSFSKKSIGRAFTHAQKMFLEMQEGDVVLTRLKGGYCLGVIATRPRMSDHKQLTWFSEIKSDWLQLGAGKDLPHHVRGKIASRKYCGTVAEIDGFAAITLKQKAGIKQKTLTHIDKNNFFLAMNDEDLEDLMAQYMSTLHRGYVFLPSSCKKNTPGIEYVMYNPQTKETIACQTKVNEIINVEDYFDYEGYEKIYLFSGKECIGDLKGNIIIVNKADLYKTLKNNKYFIDEIKQFFVLD